jgi:hypothetical protein
MEIGLFGSPEEALGDADESVSIREIAVDRQRALEFRNALLHPIGVNANDSQTRMSGRFFGRD